MENEDADQVGEPIARGRERFVELAVKHGLIRAGDPLDQNQIDFGMAIGEDCASIGDGYGDDACGGNAGEHIRAEFLSCNTEGETSTGK